MISVDALYRSIRDLARKDKAGYLSNDEYNRNLKRAQDIVLEFFFNQFEETQEVPEALARFIKTQTISVQNGLGDLPSDYELILRVTAKKPVYNDGGCEIISYDESIVTPINASEISLTKTSPIRKPSFERGTARYRTKGVSLQIFPEESIPVELEYIRTPVTPFRNVTIDVANDEENFTSSGTTNLEWGSSEERIFLDVLLYYYALPVRESEILGWLANKQGITKQITEK